MKTPKMLVEPTFDDDGVQRTAGIGVDGKEYGDPIPSAPLVELRKPDDMFSIVEQLMRQREFIEYTDRQGFDTPEEADDFDIEDDPLDPLTPWEDHFMPSRGPTAPPEAPKGGEPAASSPPPPIVAQQASNEEVKKVEPTVKRSEGEEK